MLKYVLVFFVIVTSLGLTRVDENAFSHIVREGDKTYIVDRTGHRWDVTQAESIGFKPERFQYGLGKNAFTPLDDSYLINKTDNVRDDLRVIGVADEEDARAYSVSRLSRHEISNSMVGDTPIAVGY